MQWLYQCICAVRKKILIYILGFLALLSVVATGCDFLVGSNLEPPIVDSSSEWLIPNFMALRDYALFDLGVVDFDNDGFLDVFTTNHSSKQSLLRNNDSMFVEVAEEFDLFHSWGSELPTGIASNDPPGLYIFKQDKNMVLVASNPNAFMSGEMTITITLLDNWEIVSSDNFEITEQSLPNAFNYKSTRLSLKATDDAEIIIRRPDLAGLPIDISLSDNIPLKDVFIGAEYRNPKSHEVALKGHDRHGAAWFDFDKKGFLDAFIARGGFGDALKDHVGVVNDELFILDQNDTKQMAEVFGIKKSGCRAREAGWIDINRDNRLDIYIGCLWGENQAQIQGADGLFEDKAAELLLDTDDGDAFI